MRYKEAQNSPNKMLREFLANEIYIQSLFDLAECQKENLYHKKFLQPHFIISNPIINNIVFRYCVFFLFYQISQIFKVL